MLFPFILLLLACCFSRESLPKPEGIYVTNSTGDVITSFSVRQHEDIQTLNCHVEGVSVEWSILPRIELVVMNYGGYMVIRPDDSLPKTTFTITATTRQAKYTLEFDISIDPCEYGEFTLIKTTGLGKGYFQLYQDSTLLYNNTLSSHYFCIPRQTYHYGYSGDQDVFLSVSEGRMTRFYTAFLGRCKTHEGSFSNEYTNPPSISFPSVISSIVNVEKKFFIATQGVVDSISIEPHLPVDSESSTFSVTATEEGTTTYTITASHGKTNVTSTFTLYCGSCPEGTSHVIATPSTNYISFALPSVETPLSYQYEQSFCMPEGTIPVELFGHRLSSTTALRFSENAHPIFEFKPSSNYIDFYAFSFLHSLPVTFNSTLAFFVGSPDARWAERQFKDRRWSRAQEGKWGSFDSAGKAFFRASFAVAQPMEYTYLIVRMRGEGAAEVFVNGKKAAATQLQHSLPTHTLVVSSALASGNNVVAVSLAKSSSQAILFALAVELNNSPPIQLLEGEASAVQEDPSSKYPPSAAFDGNEMSCWHTDYLPARLLFTFDEDQTVNRLLVKKPTAHYSYMLSLYGESKEGKTLLGRFNDASFNTNSTYGLAEILLDNSLPFRTYVFAFNSTEPKADISLCDARMFSTPIFTCPKKYGYEGVREGTTLYRNCPLFYTGRRSFTCVRDGTSMLWEEDKSQCFTTLPEKNLEFVDWTFTIRGMTAEDWPKRQQAIIDVLIETTYLHVSEIEFLYEDFAFDGEKMVMKAFARCTIDTLLGDLIKRSFERLMPVFGEKVAAKIGKSYQASIDSVQLHHYVNWALVISLGVVGTIVVVVLTAYLVLRLRRKSVMKTLKKSGKAEEQSLLVLRVCCHPTIRGIHDVQKHPKGIQKASNDMHTPTR